jgi:hypothetical protein
MPSGFLMDLAVGNPKGKVWPYTRHGNVKVLIKGVSRKVRKWGEGLSGGKKYRGVFER